MPCTCVGSVFLKPQLRFCSWFVFLVASVITLPFCMQMFHRWLFMKRLKILMLAFVRAAQSCRGCRNAASVLCNKLRFIFYCCASEQRVTPPLKTETHQRKWPMMDYDGCKKTTGDRFSAALSQESDSMMYSCSGRWQAGIWISAPEHLCQQKSDDPSHSNFLSCSSYFIHQWKLFLSVPSWPVLWKQHKSRFLSEFQSSLIYGVLLAVRQTSTEIRQREFSVSSESVSTWRRL